MTWILGAIGLALVAVALVDVFLVVLYVGGGAGWVTPLLSEATLRTFRGLARLVPRKRASVMSLAGPATMVVIAAGWGLLMSFGCALLMWPWLGQGIHASSGATPTDFGTAYYFAVMSLTTLGTGDLVASTTPLRLAMVAMAVLGFSLLTLGVTYVLSIYNALLRRNTFAGDLHYRTAGTGDAVAYLVRAGAGGDATPIREDQMQIMQEVVRLYESHQFYPVLHYFRYTEERYALARMALVVADANSLVRTVLDPEAHAAVVKGSATRGVWEAMREVLSGLGGTFIPPGSRPRPSSGEQAAEEEDRWRDRYHAARRRLEDEGLSVVAAAEGVERYVSLRRQWQPWIEAFAAHLDYDLERILAPSTAPAPDTEPERHGDPSSRG